MSFVSDVCRPLLSALYTLVEEGDGGAGESSKGSISEGLSLDYITTKH